MSEYTKGPWRQQPENDIESTREVLAPNGACVANVWPNYPSLPVEANARLIAAAPDLLEALKDLVEAMDTTHGARRSQKRARAAIGKAEARHD